MKESDKNISILNRDCSLKGDLHFKGYLIVAGNIEGTLNAESVVAEESSLIKADISSEYLTLGGTFEGTIIVTGTLTLLETANVVASIQCSKLIIKEGCTINGKITPLRVASHQHDIFQMEAASPSIQLPLVV